MKLKDFVLQYLTLFAVPLFVILYSLYYARFGNVAGWEGLIAAIWFMFGFFAMISTGIFLVLQRYWLKWKLNWWKNLILSVALFIGTSLLIAQIIRFIELHG